MKRMTQWARASWVFLKVLLAPRDRVVSVCQQGHSLLEGWKHCPRCQFLEQERNILVRSEKRKKEPARIGLFCTSGPHQGELFLCSPGTHRFSSSATSDLVVTPAQGSEESQFILTVDERATLTASGSKFFHVNARPTHQAELIDYDEIEALGNTFLAFELPLEANEIQEEKTL